MMFPAGYLYKKIVRRPSWIEAANIDDIYSLSGCVSENFADYIDYWKHNGYWLFDSPAVMTELAQELGLSLSGATLFYYEVGEEQFENKAKQWSKFISEPFPSAQIEKPESPQLEGFDVVTFFAGSGPECSPLSCNGLAAQIPANRHCLFDTFEQAKKSLESGEFENSEAGPFRIFAVYTVGR